jgi:hypothetical protein
VAQVTLYMDEELRSRVEEAARRADMSVSRWVVRAVTENLERSWPDGWFDLFGSLEDEDLPEASRLDFPLDLPREDFE